MNNTQSIKAALIKQIIESGANIPLGTLTGNIDLLIKSAEIDGFTQAKEIMFPTITEPELKAKDLKAGEWYVSTYKSNYTFDIHSDFLFKFTGLELGDLVALKAVDMIQNIMYDYHGSVCSIDNVESIRHASREEIIKYFPNEFEIDTHGGNDISQLTDHPNTI
jgi:hypothetical protein